MLSCHKMIIQKLKHINIPYNIIETLLRFLPTINTIKIELIIEKRG